MRRRFDGAGAAGAHREVAITTLVIHYATTLYLATASSYADWAYMHRSFPSIGPMLVGWTAVYLGGQFGSWFRSRARK